MSMRRTHVSYLVPKLEGETYTACWGMNHYSVRGKSGRRFWMVPSSSSGLIYPLSRISLSHVALLATVVWCVLIPGLLDMT